MLLSSAAPPSSAAAAAVAAWGASVRPGAGPRDLGTCQYRLRITSEDSGELGEGYVDVLCFRSVEGEKLRQASPTSINKTSLSFVLGWPGALFCRWARDLHPTAHVNTPFKKV